MEGIMMRGPQDTALAVRNTAGDIVIEKSTTTSANHPKILKLPIIRGVVAYIDSMTSGSKYLMRSAELSGLEELEAEMEREKQEKKAAKKAKKAAKENKKLASDVPVSEEPVADPLTKAPDAESNSGVAAEEKLLEEEATVSKPAAEIPVTESTTTMSNDAETTAAESEMPNKPKKEKKKGMSAGMTMLTTISMILGVVLAVALFMWLPSALYGWTVKGPIEGLVGTWFDSESTITLANSLAKSFCESCIRIVVLVGYMSLMLLMKDIRRTFRYHGAEHKSIFCYEQGLELTVENVRKQKRFHPRCGTSFLILMILVGMVISFLIDPFFMIIGVEIPNAIIRTLIKLCMLPITCGVGYELIKFAGRHDNFLTRIISIPGMLLQRLTVWEPDDSMIECAIAALKEVIPNDGSDKW